MIKGFNYPLTPKGKSTLNPPPPWYYSSDFLEIEFWADPAAVASVLPEGLDPDRSANGHANALFYDWQFSGNNDEHLDPSRYQYREFFILVDALFDGKPVAYCPYIFVDNDAAIARDYGHLTAATAAGLAAKGNVKQLVLTHVSGRYPAEEILSEATKIFPDSRVAEDFDRLVI